MKKNLVTAAATAGLLFTAFGAAANAQEITYTVHPGDSLWKISHLNNVSINQLKAWNQLSSEKIYANQKLSLAYTVKSGDSLWDLARANGTTVSELKKLNGLTSDLIRVGQQLRMPYANSSSQASISPVSNTANYVVKSGDSLSVVGKRFNVSVAQLKSINHLTSDTIYANQTLKVTGGQSTSAISVPDSDKIAGTAAGNTIKKSYQTIEKSEAAADTDHNQAASTASVNSSNPGTQAADSTEAAKTAVAADSSATAKPAAATDSTATEKPAAVTGSTTAEKPVAVSDSSVTEKPAANSNQTQKAAVNSEANGQAIIAEAEKYMGTPYRWGGNTPAGFDCSGFTKYVFNHFGISLPRTTAEQWNATTPVSSPNTGDLVFFQTYKLGPSHVGIYIGDNRFISAASNGVTISNLTATYWKTRYLGARSVR